MAQIITHGREVRLIYVSEDQLKQVQYLIDQSVQGNHVLFHPREVREAFDFLESFDESIAYGVEHHIERLLTLGGLDEKRAYLEALENEERCQVIRTYFNIIENNIYEENGVRH